MLCYGLTGGIGSGKSTVRAMFAERGAATFDADGIGRELLAGSAPLLERVKARFPGCVDQTGLDRKRLAAIVFSDAEARRWLEDELHPAILAEFLRRREALAQPHPAVCLLEGALLMESRTPFPLAGLIVVWAPWQSRLERLALRDGFDRTQAEARLQAQLSQAEKMARATFLIDNGGTLQNTRQQVLQVWDQLSREARGEP
jgi:dephospho-CoA kinase